MNSPARSSATDGTRPERPGDVARLEHVVGLMAAGDQVAFAEFYDLLAPLVYALACRVIRDVDYAEEGTQDGSSNCGARHAGSMARKAAFMPG